MNKKLALALIGLSSNLSFAGTIGTIIEKTSQMKEGFYLGAGIGGAMYNDKY